jgi:hypothetical protein
MIKEWKLFATALLFIFIHQFVFADSFKKYSLFESVILKVRSSPELLARYELKNDNTNMNPKADVKKIFNILTKSGVRTGSFAGMLG